MRSIVELDRVEDTRDAPEDNAWAVEQAQDEWERGYLSGEFDEEIGGDHPLVQELHGRIDARHETERERWAALRGFLWKHFPHTYYAAMDRVIEQRIATLLNE